MYRSFMQLPYFLLIVVGSCVSRWHLIDETFSEICSPSSLLRVELDASILEHISLFCENVGGDRERKNSSCAPVFLLSSLMRVCLNALSRFVMEWLYQSQRRAGYVSPISESHLQTLFCGTPEKKSLGALSYVVQDEFVNKWKYWRFRSAQISLILYARETVIVKYFYFYFHVSIRR